MELIKIRNKGQITLPLSIRKVLQVEAGDHLVCEIEENRLVLYKMPLYRRSSFNDGIWQLVGSAEDKEGKNDVAANKHKYLGEK